MSSEKTFVSVVVPIRNEEKNIAGCLQSVVKQTYPSEMFEVLVIDGFSDDQTRRIVRDFQSYHPQVQLLDNPRRIVPTALNIALKAARGDVIIRVDGHAEIAPDYLEKCVEYLHSSGADCTGGYILSINDSFVGKAIALAMSSPFGVGNARFRTSGKSGFVDTLAFGAYQREIFQKIGNFDEELVRCQDDEFNYRLRKAGGKIFFTPEIRSKYYPRTSLKKLWKQYFGYGFWKIRVMQKHLKMMQLRQFIPPAFVGFLLLSLLLGILGTPLALNVFFGVAGIYASAVLFASVSVAIKHGLRYLILLPVIFPILHISYGSGFLLGLFKFAPRWFDQKSKKIQYSASEI